MSASRSHDLISHNHVSIIANLSLTGFIVILESVYFKFCCSIPNTVISHVTNKLHYTAT